MKFRILTTSILLSLLIIFALSIEAMSDSDKTKKSDSFFASMINGIIDLGTNPDDIDTEGFTLLMRATRGDANELIPLVLPYSMNPDRRNPDQNMSKKNRDTVLMIAAQEGRYNAVEKLLEGTAQHRIGEYLKRLQQMKKTYFHLLPSAILNEVVQCKVNRANPNLKNKKKKTALDHAVISQANEVDPVKKENYKKIIALLQPKV